MLLSSAAFPSLSSEVNNDNSQFLPATTPSSRAASLAAPILGSFNSNSEVTIVAVRAGAAIDAADQAALARVIAATRSVARVGSVRELAVSADGSAVRILVRARINEADITHHKTLITDFEGVLVDAHPPPGLVIKLAGEVATNVANQAKASAQAPSWTCRSRSGAGQPGGSARYQLTQEVGRVGERRLGRAAVRARLAWFPPAPHRSVHAVLSHTAHRRSSPSAFSVPGATAGWVVARRWFRWG